jgi:hypothetical protein
MNYFRLNGIFTRARLMRLVLPQLGKSLADF